MTHHKDDYISLTDMVQSKNAEIPGTIVSLWLSTVFSVNYMGLWKKINNPDFNVTEFGNIKIGSINALLIRREIPQRERLVQLNSTAITQMKSLVGGTLAKRLE